MSVNSTSASSKSAVTALLLCFFLGTFGVHRFYLGKIKTAVLMLLTLGGLGIWSLCDLVLIACGDATDDEGRALKFTAGGDSRGGLIGRILAMAFGFMPMSLLLAVFVALAGSDGVSHVVNQQLEAIRDGDLSLAYSYTSAGFQEETTLDTFKAFVDAYPVIKNNVSAKFPTREIDNQQGYLSGTIYDKKGNSIDIEYQLTYEKNTWKILGLRVNPNENETANDEEEVKPAATETSSKKNLTFDDTVGKYSIQYPDNWMFEKTDTNSVMFSGKKGTPAYASTVTVQVLPMKKTGGIYKNAKAIVEDLKGQIKEKTTKAVFTREGEAELPLNPKEFKGYYFEVSYTYRGVPIKKMQFVIVNPANTMGYSWGYTTDSTRYDIDLPIAKTMYESWSIHK